MGGIKIVIESVGVCSDSEILNAIRKSADVLQNKRNGEYWMTEEGQDELMKKIELNSKPPTGHLSGGLSVFDYTDASKAMLCSAGAGSAGDDGEWIEIEMTADTGACDTVMPRSMASHIPIQPSLQSLKSMEYEVANGKTLPNLGERRCVMWTENASESKKINLQVADVHKALLSLSRCADMGYESRFGRRAGALIDEESGEVIPLQRKGNLYVLKCWLKAAPFGWPENR